MNGRFRRGLEAVSLSLVAMLAACVAFLDGVPELGEHCSFEGERETCGRCLADRCRAEIDACCGGCGDALTDLDACAPGGDVEACDRLERAADGDDAVALASCVELSCGDACPSSVPVTRCVDEDEGCSCRFDEDAPNDATCEASPGVCCAEPGWPAADLDCTCVAIGCTRLDDLCWCGPGAGEAESCSGLGLYCCADQDFCECRDTPCDAVLGEVEVPSCSVLPFTCGDGTIEVDRCHASGDDLD